MELQLQETWKQLRDALASPESHGTALTLGFYLLLGGALALLIRILYRRFSTTPSSSESITRVFPLLVIVTTAVIAVVKSSVALSLGLVGALSIVRFRAAIKEPEELVYLFLCIALGLSLGAEQPLIAVALTVTAALFILGMHFLHHSSESQDLLLTITGEERLFGSEEPNVIQVLDEVASGYFVQRLDIEDGRGQIRVYLPRSNESQVSEVIKRLRAKLPTCQLSYVNLSVAI